jgi:DNA-binding transcriptional MerR regulator
VASAGEKAPGAFKTIGELSQELGVAQHILRYWETKFPQLKPLQRAGNRRYYRTADVDLAHRINRLLNEEGYTVRGVQKLLRGKQPTAAVEQATDGEDPGSHLEQGTERPQGRSGADIARLIELRDRLADALDD